MSLPKKKSRLITVYLTKYRWTISPNEAFAIFIAEKEGCKARKIEVHFKTDIDKYWVEFPNIDGLDLKVLQPNEMESIIKSALKQGWKPDEKGEPMVFDWQDGQLTERKKLK